MNNCTHCDAWQPEPGTCRTCGLAPDATPREDAEMMRAACLALVRTINATGGVTPCGDLVADEEWADLGDAYFLACAALGFKAKENGASSETFSNDDRACGPFMDAVQRAIEESLAETLAEKGTNR